MSRYVLSVPDMACHHCVARITKTLEKEGLPTFKVLLDDKTVDVETEALDALLGALDDASYPASVKEGPI